MSKLITATFIIMTAVALQAGSASACNRTNGCAFDTIYESVSMMQSGRMAAAMDAGRANTEAFEALKSGSHSSKRRK